MEAVAAFEATTEVRRSRCHTTSLAEVQRKRLRLQGFELAAQQSTALSRAQKARLWWRYAKGVIRLPQKGSERYHDDAFCSERLAQQLVDWYKWAWAEVILAELMRLRNVDPLVALSLVASAMTRRAGLPPGELTEVELAGLANTPVLHSMATRLNRLLKTADEQPVGRTLAKFSQQARRVRQPSPEGAYAGVEGEANVDEPVWSALFFLCDVCTFEAQICHPGFGGDRLLRLPQAVLVSLVPRCMQPGPRSQSTAHTQNRAHNPHTRQLSHIQCIRHNRHIPHILHTQHIRHSPRNLHTLHSQRTPHTPNFPYRPC